MTSTAVLAQADSVANWVGAIGQWAGAVATLAAVIVALRLTRWERRRDRAERRDREAAQARLVTITVRYTRSPEPSEQDFVPCVEITNHSEQPVHRPQIESISGARSRARWGVDPSTGKDHSLCEVLPPNAWHRVPFQHLDADGHAAFVIESVGVGLVV